MSKTLRHLIWIVSLAVMGTGVAQRVGQGSTIRFGIVRNVQQVPLQSDAATGAVVGGTIGLVAGGRRPARNAILGAAAGGAVTAAAQGNRTGFAYMIPIGPWRSDLARRADAGVLGGSTRCLPTSSRHNGSPGEILVPSSTVRLPCNSTRDPLRI
jgi:hypothetical protein